MAHTTTPANSRESLASRCRRRWPLIYPSLSAAMLYPSSPATPGINSTARLHTLALPPLHPQYDNTSPPDRAAATGRRWRAYNIT
uniref:Uncharacterized protein n=1 Tax=Leersia perrieri TaxID=77586 RepID=A0A0D9VTJ1_9ORYZ